MNDDAPSSMPSAAPTGSYHAPSHPPEDSPQPESGPAPLPHVRVELIDAIPERLGDYVILSILGEGGMGTVCLGEDIRLGRRVAIKTMKPVLRGR